MTTETIEAQAFAQTKAEALLAVTTPPNRRWVVRMIRTGRHYVARQDGSTPPRFYDGGRIEADAVAAELNATDERGA